MSCNLLIEAEQQVEGKLGSAVIFLISGEYCSEGIFAAGNSGSLQSVEYVPSHGEA